MYIFLQAMHSSVIFLLLCSLPLNIIAVEITRSNNNPLFFYSYNDGRISRRSFTGLTNFSAIDFKICSNKSYTANEYNFKIATWNVYGVRTLSKREFLPYLSYENPDIFCVQHLGCSTHDLPAHILHHRNYHIYVHTNTSRSLGIMLYSKIKPLNIIYGIGDQHIDQFATTLTAEYEKFYLVSTEALKVKINYSTTLELKMWNKAFIKFSTELDKTKPVIIAGTLMGVNLPIDYHPAAYRSSGTRLIDKKAFQSLINSTFVDVYRHFYPEVKDRYSQWMYESKGRSKNIGKRLDYFLVSNRLLPNCVDLVIRTDVYGSTHCPLAIFLHV